jgi:uncharacterized damage-inducible protein DinB
MTSSDVVRSALAGYFRMIQAELHELVEPISSDQLWRKPYSYGNSIGNLVLHLTGNLNYYIGAQIAGTGYVRHRDSEFADSGKPKDALLREFDASIEIALSTIAQQTDADWAKPYSAEREPESQDRFTAILRCAGHAYHHVGQTVYLQRELLKES